MIQKVELLAPAGNLQKLKIAILYGADAVYIGGKKFSLRARASNFTLDDMVEGVLFAHQHHAKIYVTMNILPHNEDLEGLDEYLLFLEHHQFDGIITSSLYILARCQEITPHLEVHMSTQLSSMNAKTCSFYESLGAKRVVLARELDLEQIKQIKLHTTIGLEVFIHGGMCSSISGRCMLSNYMANRDANRGGCAHSCRWNYTLYENENTPKEAFHMGAKDLSLVSYMKEILSIGVDSLKIEGRMKSEYYIATIVNTYRHLIDDILANKEIDEKKYMNEIMKAENRNTSTGFICGDVTLEQQLFERDERPTKEFVGYVLDFFPLKEDSKDGYVMLQQRNYFQVGNELEFFGPTLSPTKVVVNKMWNEKQEEVEVAPHPLEILYFYLPFRVSKHDMVRLVLS